MDVLSMILLVLCVSIVVDWIAYLARSKTQSIIYSILIASAIVFILLYGGRALGWT